jgi:hypothetical protein
MTRMQWIFTNHYGYSAAPMGLFLLRCRILLIG